MCLCKTVERWISATASRHAASTQTVQDSHLPGAYWQNKTNWTSDQTKQDLTWLLTCARLFFSIFSTVTSVMPRHCHTTSRFAVLRSLLYHISEKLMEILMDIQSDGVTTVFARRWLPSSRPRGGAECCFPRERQLPDTGLHAKWLSRQFDASECREDANVVDPGKGSGSCPGHFGNVFSLIRNSINPQIRSVDR